MKHCNHEPEPKAGYGVTTGQHVCRHCGETIAWVGGSAQYTLVKIEDGPQTEDSLWLDIFWACVLALVLAIVSAARHW